MSAARLRIVTFNTWKNEGGYFARLPAMIAGLRSLAPDLVLLQEAFRTADDTVHTARTLAEALNLGLAYAPARAMPRHWQGRNVLSESGLAILARGTFAEQVRLPLPSDEKGGERIAILAEVLIAGQTIFAGCTHLSHLRGDNARRREQLETILAHPRWSAPAVLRVLGGDFNATADSAALNWLHVHPALTVQNVFAPQAESHTTFPRPLQSGRAGRAIDFIFTLQPHGETLPKIYRAGLGLDAPLDQIWPSDHAAVYADCELSAPR